MQTDITNETTALIQVEQLNPLDLFTGDAMEPLVAQIRAKVESVVTDASTAKGRKEIASLARRVASSKVVLDGLGKKLVTDWKQKAKKVDEVRKGMRDELDFIRDEARRPLTEWEEEEEKRRKQEAFNRQYDSDWDEAHSQEELFERERIVREKEAEIARVEAERKAKEEAARLEREQKEREERIAREAAEQAKRDAEEAVARAKAEAEQAERDRVAAEARAKAEQEAAVREAERRAKEEALRELALRERLEQEEKDRLARIAADKDHRTQIEADIKTDIRAIWPNTDGSSLIEHINEGHIRHITITY